MRQLGFVVGQGGGGGTEWKRVGAARAPIHSPVETCARRLVALGGAREERRRTMTHVSVPLPSRRARISSQSDLPLRHMRLVHCRQAPTQPIHPPSSSFSLLHMVVCRYITVLVRFASSLVFDFPVISINIQPPTPHPPLFTLKQASRGVCPPPFAHTREGPSTYTGRRKRGICPPHTHSQSTLSTWVAQQQQGWGGRRRGGWVGRGRRGWGGR